MNTALPAAEGHTTLYHRRHARQKVAKSLGHLAPALILLLGIVPLLSGAEPLTPLLAVEIAVGTAYLGLMVRELLHLRHNPFHREPVAWLELAAAGILALESYHIWHRHHEAALAGAPPRLHVLPWLYAATAVMYVVLAFRLNKLTDRHFMRLHAGGFAVRTKRLGPAHELTWPELAAVEPVGPADVLVHRADGHTHRISFANLHDGATHRDRLVAHFQAERNS